jgi:tRNA (cytidine56-2'-O)-methyltransferase
MKAVVLRLDHRHVRDKRVTTHLLLCARALGADGAFYSGEMDKKIERSVRRVADNWGGDFNVVYTKNWRQIVRNWEGKIVHLTMYGIPIQDAIEEFRGEIEPLLVVVGGPKVPADIYELADWNISITTQPHSEVSALAIFLHYLFEGVELKKEFQDAKFRIKPSKYGRMVNKVS